MNIVKSEKQKAACVRSQAWAELIGWLVDVDG